MHIAVVGGGIVGTLAALNVARLGHRVDLFDAAPELWSGASASNEGKIHLGAVYALGTAGTHDVMLRGAIAFAPCVEAAIGQGIDWDEIAGDHFDHLVMPDSLAGVDELRGAYAAINERASRAIGTADRYLGRRIDQIVETRPRRDSDTGLPSFTTRDRAVDPLRLRELVLAALGAQPLVRVVTNTRVTRVTTDGDTATIHLARSSDQYDAVINAAWAWQNLFAVPAVPRNFRVKAAVRLKPGVITRTVTIVQGPYGDVVAHRDFGYASWYPTGRLVTEHGLVPSAEAESAVASIALRDDLVRSQLDALADIGLLPGGVVGEAVGGIIVGDGTPDIHDRTSLLHGRPEFGASVHGRIVTPATFKFTTGPLAAKVAAATVARWA